MVRGYRHRASTVAFLSWKGGPEREPQGGAPGRPRRLGVPQIIAIALRLISLALVLIAVLLLGADALTSLDDGGQLHVRSLAMNWAALSPQSLEGFRFWLGRLWHPALGWADSFLSLPGWGVTGVAGVLLAFLAGRRASK
ncbi:MAG: hypothetical protein J0H30_11450 [Alphaproteobacteria bacterium]|nr:hypothetical protein [Alphaproteobacteria bacterium]MBN9571631.1 hypothetical protein [Alphaproteobacteria bacterium]MBN9577346.1 hypothetical protein [Alphaproteobacteria bacterium]OJU57635.1 MAG: hypothetical protein BGO00_04445 [Alphaproteobacteria bacterium 62-8]